MGMAFRSGADSEQHLLILFSPDDSWADGNGVLHLHELVADIACRIIRQKTDPPPHEAIGLGKGEDIDNVGGLQTTTGVWQNERLVG
jgi:hypothetical protein